MALNAHIAFFNQDYTDPESGIPTAGDAEATSLLIAGDSAVVPQANVVTSPSTDPSAEERWIDVMELEFHIRSDTANFHSMEIVKQRDRASPLLALHCAQQTKFNAVKILVLASNDNQVVEETIRLYGVRIESFRASLATKTVFGGDSTASTSSIGGTHTLTVSTSAASTQTASAIESLTLKYDQVTWKRGDAEQGWDRIKNESFSGPAVAPPTA